MRIRWTSAAADDLQHIFDYLRETNPSLARSTIIEIREGIRSLKNFPH
jgi:plasmid stabilization system protein ParE